MLNQKAISAFSQSKKGFTWPGHNYLGPGNPIDNGPTVNTADEIAKKHDIKYSESITPEDIYNAD